ncbi:MAG: hypothetical protein DWQ01_07445 [Planctomycetota bacterium]|nr:MAG: hypothetical protein DWQ01_07445 [Planctomycetota bacterium]
MPACLLLSLVTLAQDPTELAQEPQDGASEEELWDEGLEDLLGGVPSGELGSLEEGGGLRIASLRGSVGSRYRYFFRDRDTGLNDQQWFFEGDLELDLDINESWSGFVQPRFRLDLYDSELRRFEPFEAYLNWRGESSDLRLGQMVENWGIADTYNPLDVLNRRDFASDFLDPDRLGEMGLRYRMHFPSGEVLGEPTLALYLIPVFRRTEFPTASSRYSLGAGPIPFREQGSITPDGEDQIFGAVRALSTLDTSVFNADFHLLAARGPEPFPTLMPRFKPNFTVDVVPVYYGGTTLGAGLRAVPDEQTLGSFLSEFTFKFEGAYKQLYKFPESPISAPEDYFTYVVGLDRVLDRPFGEKDQLTLTLEYAGENGASDPTSQLRFFRSDGVLRLFWEANNFSRTSLEARWIQDLDTGERIVQVIFESQLRFLHEDLRFWLDYQVFHLEPGEPSLLNFFPNGSSITTGIFLDF